MRLISYAPISTPHHIEKQDKYPPFNPPASSLKPQAAGLLTLKPPIA
ncbi:MAG: hypothetical protein ACJAU9_001108 [Lentimonas sp.]|jgi:hypothetical protein